MHPAVIIIRDEIKRLGLSYVELSDKTGISEYKIKNIMSGRTTMSLETRDIICKALNISPVNVVLSRHDIALNDEFLDLRWMPDDIREPFLLLVKLLKEKIQNQ